jgi:hypothetical protein
VTRGVLLATARTGTTVILLGSALLGLIAVALAVTAIAQREKLPPVDATSRRQWTREAVASGRDKPPPAGRADSTAGQPG